MTASRPRPKQRAVRVVIGRSTATLSSAALLTAAPARAAAGSNNYVGDDGFSHLAGALAALAVLETVDLRYI